MTTSLQPPLPAEVVESASDDAPGRGRPLRRFLSRRRWNRFSLVQLLVMGVSTVAPAVIVATLIAAAFGFMTVETMMTVALGAGENPGMITFGAMFLASPVQWLTGRSQVRVRKYLAIVFFLLAANNGLMFAIEHGSLAGLGGAAFSAPFLVAGSLALALAVPLFSTSSRLAQRRLGLRRWQLLHRATYLVAVALLVHVAMIPDLGPGFVLITLGFIARIPMVRSRLSRFPAQPRAATHSAMA